MSLAPRARSAAALARLACYAANAHAFAQLRTPPGSNPSSCFCKSGPDNKKSSHRWKLTNQTGGGGGIRTLVTLYRPNGFRDRRIQPLCHPSAWGRKQGAPAGTP